MDIRIDKTLPSVSPMVSWIRLLCRLTATHPIPCAEGPAPRRLLVPVHPISINPPQKPHLLFIFLALHVNFLESRPRVFSSICGSQLTIGDADGLRSPFSFLAVCAEIARTGFTGLFQQTFSHRLLLYPLLFFFAICYTE